MSPNYGENCQIRNLRKSRQLEMAPVHGRRRTDTTRIIDPVGNSCAKAPNSDSSLLMFQDSATKED